MNAHVPNQSDTAAIWRGMEREASQPQSCHINKNKYTCCILALPNQILKLESIWIF